MNEHRRFINAFALFLACSVVYSGGAFVVRAQEATHAKSPAASTGGQQQSDLPTPLFTDYTEDNNSLSLQGSTLSPRPPIVGEKDEFPTFTRELIQLQWRPGDSIDLYVIKPRNVSKPPVILYLYSYPTETDRFRNNAYCERITKGGFAAVGFVSALTGQRYHDRPMREWFVSELPEALSHSVHDVQMILNYLATRNDMNMNAVGIFGQGSGATIAALAASVDQRIRSLNLIDPWGDWPVWMAKSSLVPEEERARYLKPEFQSKIADLDPLHVLPRLTGKNLHAEFIMDDAVTPAAALEALRRSLPSAATAVEYKTSQEHFAASTEGRSFEWIKAQLKPATRSSQSVKLQPDKAKEEGRKEP